MNRVMTMGELTASIAHEVNQPLAAIIAPSSWGPARQKPNHLLRGAQLSTQLPPNTHSPRCHLSVASLEMSPIYTSAARD